MSGPLSVLWTVSPAFAPRPWLNCSRCGRVRPFASSGRFRLNTNGRLLDAWLIYRCSDCDRTWNRPVLERRPLGGLAPGQRAALEANDCGLAERIAFDLPDLARHSHRIAQSEGVAILRSQVGPAPEEPERLDLLIVATAAVGTRLDKVLAEGLCLPRARIRRLHEEGRLTFPSAGARPLGRPLPERLGVALVLSGLADRHTIAEAAAGAP